MHTSFFTGHIYCTPIGCLAQPQALVRHLSCPLGQPHLGQFQPQGCLQAQLGGGPHEGWGGSHQPASRLQAAGGRRHQRPLLAGSLWAHLGEQRQWWLLLQPSPLPTGTASGLGVSRLPAPQERPSWEWPGAAQGDFLEGGGWGGWAEKPVSPLEGKGSRGS